MAFYPMDPWGDQRADQRAALIAISAMQSKNPPSITDLLLHPDDLNDLPEDVTSEEQRWMLTLTRNEGD